MERGDIEELIRSTGRSVKTRMKIVHDTTEFMNLDQGDVMVLGNVPYLILRNEKEAGYGFDDEPKYWVKRTIDLNSGDKKIVKLVFFEKVTVRIGEITVPLFRSPGKEAKILDLVADNPHFMHGFSVSDSVGNLARVIEFIDGPSINKPIINLPLTHEQYFHEELPKWLPPLSTCLKSLAILHDHDLVHGDIRWDHIFIDRDSGHWRWIDFDYDYHFPESPFGIDLFGVGKVLSYVIGKGPHFYADIKNDPGFRAILPSLVQEDFSLLEHQKIMNLKKLYPYIPDSLNNILLHFSGHTDVFYGSIHEILDDLAEAMAGMGYAPGAA